MNGNMYSNKLPNQSSILATGGGQPGHLLLSDDSLSRKVVLGGA
jgi:hypothetical protein